MQTSLRGKCAVVGGSTQGIGLAVARALAAEEASVVLLARDAVRLEAAVHGLPTPAGQQHGHVAADFQDLPQVQRAIADILSRYGTVHILVNNTGGPPGGKAIDAGPQEYERAFSQHLICNQTVTQAVVPGMHHAGYGRIVNIISTSVKQPIRGLGVSNTIRAAVANWAKTLSIELGPLGITVNNVLPGFTDTARLHSLIRARAEQQGRPTEEIEEEMRRSIPLGRFAAAAEIAAAVAFLVSPAAAYISGVNLPVDGGRTECL